MEEIQPLEATIMALSIGQLAPDFVLEGHLGKKVRLGDYRGSVNVVLVFFPLAWTRV
jgi:mycoredoxin-dependent peroxiredoxin